MVAQSRITAFAATAGPAGSLAFCRDACEPELQPDNPFAILCKANSTDLRGRKVKVGACPPILTATPSPSVRPC